MISQVTSTRSKHVVNPKQGATDFGPTTATLTQLHAMAPKSNGSASSKRLQASRREKTRDERLESTTASDSPPRKRVRKEATLEEAGADKEVQQDEEALSSPLTDLPLELVLEVRCHCILPISADRVAPLAGPRPPRRTFSPSAVEDHEVS